MNKIDKNRASLGHVIAVVPARSGSKGLPGKNLLSIKGKSLITHAVESAIGCSMIDETYISTDSPIIENDALLAGARTLGLRPPELSSDDASIFDVLGSLLNELKIQGCPTPDTIVLLQPTSPLRSVEHVREALKIFEASSCNSLVSVTRAPVPRAWYRSLDSSQQIICENIEEHRNRQKDRDEYIPNGAIYIFKQSAINDRSWYQPPVQAYIMNREVSVDIDTRMDWLLANALLDQPLNTEDN